MADSREDSLPRVGSPCPKCGVMVAPGYPRCPKCRARMPAATTPSGAVSGGTVLPESSGAGALVAGGAVAVLVVAGTIFFIVRGRDDEGAPEPTTQAPGDLERRPAPVRRSSARHQAAAPVPKVEAFDLGIDSAAGKAASALRVELDKQRLWSEVELAEDDPTLILRSGYCADRALRAVLDSMKKNLREAQLRGARCYARHGRLIFEESF